MVRQILPSIKDHVEIHIQSSLYKIFILVPGAGPLVSCWSFAHLSAWISLDLCALSVTGVVAKWNILWAEKFNVGSGSAIQLQDDSSCPQEHQHGLNPNSIPLPPALIFATPVNSENCNNYMYHSH